MAHEEDVHEIVIVGGGICGLATALALHRKGISSLVLERSDTLRSTGAAIGLWNNGWRVLEELGVADELRKTSHQLTEVLDQYWGSDGKSKATTTPIIGEFRSVKRRLLIEALAAPLPLNAIRLGYRIDGITTDPVTSFPILHTADGRSLKAKMLIGCDGSNSAVAKYLGLKPTVSFPRYAVRGFTTYPEGHGFGTSFLRLRVKDSFYGRVPITDHLVHFFFTVKADSIDPEITQSTGRIKELALEKVKEWPSEFAETVKRCDEDSLSMTKIWTREPWHLLRTGKFHKGGVTVAGDAMHVMGPFLGQGGASAMEDSIVLARRIAQAMASGEEGKLTAEKIEAAQRMYVQERQARLLYLSSSSYTRGSLISSSSAVKKLIFVLILAAFFGGFNDNRHNRFDCGPL